MAKTAVVDLFPLGVVVICYASHTGTRRNIEAMRARGWGLLVSRGDRPSHWRTEGFTHWAVDNGAWADFQANRAFDEEKYERFLDWVEAQTTIPAWCVLPDIVAGGAASLALSARYRNRCATVAPLVLIAVQNGMTTQDLAPLVGPSVGIFLGGDTTWKLATMRYWGEFCAERDLYYHVARVNTTRRMSLAIWAGAHSIDGTSVTRYATNLPKLDGASRYRDLFPPTIEVGR